MKRTWLLATTLALLGVGPGGVDAAIIGVVAPTSGSYALLGAQVLAGARAAAEMTGDTLVEINEDCEAEDATAVADQLTEAKAVAALGFLCSETLIGALPQLKAEGMPAITLSVRSSILMEDALRDDLPLFRMAPAEGDEAERISAVILDHWKAEPIALIEDGTIYGRELVSAVRGKIEEAGLAPVFVDTFRPGQEQQVALVRRLQKAGATHVFIGGDRTDISIIARDAAAENVGLQIMGGDTMRATNRPVPLREGTAAIALPDYSALPEASQAVEALRSRLIEPEGYVLPAYAAVQIMSQASRATPPMAQALQSLRFQTVIGTLSFGQDHELAENPLRLQEWRNGTFLPAEVPTD
ncbi:MAG: branched-chain amino acid ABC transporter substrate-binding protein [Pseudorhizobium sp.]